jgi:hypothetical protein
VTRRRRRLTATVWRATFTRYKNIFITTVERLKDDDDDDL